MEKDPTARCVVTIAASGAETAFSGTFSGGLDLSTPNEDGFAAFDLPLVVMKLLKRLLLFPLPTICIFNGHAVAGGLFLGLCHDFRFMVYHKAIVSLPEIFLDMTMSPPYAAIMRHLLQPQALRLLVLGKRYNGKQALKMGIVDDLFKTDEELWHLIYNMKNEVGIDSEKREALSEIKRGTMHKITKSLESIPPVTVSRMIQENTKL